MNITKSQIAGLVLGYLKGEKLHSVVEEFVNCSRYFEENHDNIKMGKYFVTRVAGLSLVDFLEQYAVIYCIVQSRLEETDYYSRYSRTTLVEQLIYLLDQQLTHVGASTPVLNSSEVDTTPAHALPGNSSSIESDDLASETPKKKAKNKDRDAAVDVSDLRQSLLENHELHEKLAESINIVRSTPEASKSSPDEISAGASKEIDAVIKNVIQKTVEDPAYNRLIDELIGATSYESSPSKKLLPHSTPTTSVTTEDASKSKSSVETLLNTPQIPNNFPDPMDDHNNDAIRSIIEVSQNPDPPPLAPPPPPDSESLSSSNRPEASAEVYVFDGTLDTYLKTSGATNPISSNAVYYNSNSLIVVPPAEAVSKQYYIVNNNQPLLKMATPAVLTEQELMSMPTIIVSDEKAPSVDSEPQAPPPPVQSKKAKPKRVRPPRPKSTHSQPILPKVTESVPIVAEPVPETAEVVRVTVTREATSSVGNAPRQGSHVRNLDFSTPSCRSEWEKRGKSEELDVWDAGLRKLVAGCRDKSPSPKKKRPCSTRKKKTAQTDEVDQEVENLTEMKENVDIEAREKIGLTTPTKDIIPTTPGAMLDTSGMHCTPFNDVIDDQLKGVDLNLIPTPSIPITPGFSLTPGDMLSTNQRLTDYSTSSSYYQPSDSEQKVTMSQLIQECKGYEKDDQKEPKSTEVKILSNVVIEEGKIPEKDKKTEGKKTNERLKKFNNNIIGKKNLSLIRRPTSSSSSSESDSDSDEDRIESNSKNGAVNKDSTDTIKDIIHTVQVHSTLDKHAQGRLSNLELVRQRTIDQLKKSKPVKKPVRNNRTLCTTSRPAKPKTPKRKTKKKETIVEENTDEEAQKLVEGLAQRGIHLIPNKTPQKKIAITELAEIPQSEDCLTFDKRVYDTFETMKFSRRKVRRQFDFSVLKKSLSTNVFFEDLNKEVTRVMRWTSCDCLLDVDKLKVRTEEQRKELGQYCFGESFDEELPDFAAKGSKKRKTPFFDDNQQKEKKSKVLSKLLDNIGVDCLLDKVHGE